MEIRSNCKMLDEAFIWAQEKIRSHVVTGTKCGEINKGDGEKWYGPNGEKRDAPDAEWAYPKDYIASYWAGYHDRTAFYIRDFVHQAKGAHFAGLDSENFSMLHSFAKTASEKTQYYALWALNFDGSTYYMDTPDEKRFVREITAQFELVETVYELYLLTGDRRYIDDETIFGFVKNIMTEFIKLHDTPFFGKRNGIPKGKGDIFECSATYNERGFVSAEAGDSIAALYKARLAFCEILSLRGDTDGAKYQKEEAEKLKSFFENEWSVIKGSEAYCYAVDTNGKKHYKWKKTCGGVYGAESCFFMPLKGITAASRRSRMLLDYIFKKQKSPLSRQKNTESLTYMPDLFFMWHQNERAWFFMRHIIEKKDLPHEHKTQGTNGDYPEISFTLVSQVLCGLAGIKKNADKRVFSSCAQLPKEIEKIEISDIAFCEADVSLSVSRKECLLKNNTDNKVTWLCRFEGEHETFCVNGKTVCTEKMLENGTAVSYCKLSVKAGETAKIICC